MHKQTENGLLAKAFLVVMAFFALKTGLFFATFEYREINSYLHDTLASVFSLEAFALVFIGVALAYVHASILPLGNRRSWILLYAGIAGGILYALYAMAAVETAPSFYAPLRYSAIAGGNFIIAVIGGWSLWNARK